MSKLDDGRQEEALTEEKWNAIVRNDAVYDGEFWYAVKTTRIFCRPSCKSKKPKKENVRIFGSPEQAIAAGFRPCKRCKPTGHKMPDDEWTQLIKDYIDSHYSEPLTLEHLADVSHGSPYHMQRTFTRIVGISPAAYMTKQRIESAKRLLAESKSNVSIVGSQVGLANTPYFVTLFKKSTGFTPAAYRDHIRKEDARNEE